MPKDMNHFDLLLQKLQMHDLDAFDSLYRSARERLYLLAQSILKDSAAAQDLVQEFFMDFWEQRRYEQVQSSLEAYMVRAIRNRAYNYLDKQATRQRLKDDFVRLQQESFEAPDKMENEVLGRQLGRAIGHLPPMAARVFRLHYIEKLSHASIAEQLHISKSTVSGHMDRALKQLREELKKEL